MKNLFLLFSILYLNFSFAESDKYRVVFTDDPSTTAVIEWNAISGSNQMLYYDIVDYGQNIGSYANHVNPTHTNSEKSMNNKFVKLTGLTPNTVYYFVVADDDYTSQRFWFKTIPDDHNIKLSFIVGGDSRNNRNERRNANLIVAKVRPDAVFFGGDYVYAGTDEQWQEWFDDWQSTIASDGRMTPIVPGQGNHELIWNNFPNGNDNVDELFYTEGQGGEHYFALTFGGDLIRFYTLDSEKPLSTSYGQQTTWFQNDVNSHLNNIWLAAQYHSPMRPFNDGKPEGSKQFDEWAPIFEQYRFAFISENDAHLCKATYPIVRGSGEDGFVRDDINGVVYVGEGGWGAPLRDDNLDRTWARYHAKINQVKWVTVSKDTITIRTIDTDNATDVGELTDANRFDDPVNANFYPDENEVIIIQKLKEPLVEITEPQDLDFFQSPQLIDIYVNAIDTFTGIDYVEMYVNDTLLSSDNSFPYEFQYNIPMEGIYQLKARAVNNQGVAKSSDITEIACGETSGVIIVNTADYGEENVEDGSVDVGSSDLELVKESGVLGIGEYIQEVGIRYNNINIPQFAVIDSAFVQFTVDEDNNENACNLNIFAEDISSSLSYSDNDYNVSSRTKTTNYVVWSPANWNTSDGAGANQKTTDIKSVIQEVVDRTDWVSGNSMSLIITGTGRRTAETNTQLQIYYHTNIRPQIEFTTPVNNQVYTELNPVSIQVEANDFDGIVTNVDIYDNLNNIIAQFTSAPYTTNFTATSNGEYMLKAVATDDFGQRDSTYLNIIFTDIPEVELIVPAQDTTIYNLNTLNIEANAYDDNLIDRVEFFVDGMSLSTDNTYPYTATWTPPAYGNYIVRAVAFDEYNTPSVQSNRNVELSIDNSIDNSIQTSLISVYPNPVKDVLTINFDNSISKGEALIVLYDISGKKLMQNYLKINNNKIMINITHLNKGDYILNVKANNKEIKTNIILK